jgi:hypothetical protein
VVGAETEPEADLTAEVELGAPPHRTDLHDPSQRAEVERALTTVPGVLGARLVPGFDRPVDELHVLTSLSKAPKQAVRDLQTVLMARFGVSTDHRVISVVQLDDDAIAGGPERRGRVVVGRVAVAHEALEVQATVVLRDGDDELLGEATGPSSATGQRRAVAEATLAAIRPVLADTGRISLDGADVSEVLGRRVAIALVGFRTGRGEHTVAGSAMVRDAEADAIARSVLDALNRSIAEAPR